MILLNSRQFYFIQNIEDEDGGVEWSGVGGGEPNRRYDRGRKEAHPLFYISGLYGEHT